MIENIHEIISDYKRIKRNVEGIVRGTIHDESVPLLIRADILLSSELGRLFVSEEEKDFSLKDLLSDMSNPNLSEAELESLYKQLEWFVNNEIVEIISIYE